MLSAHATHALHSTGKAAAWVNALTAAPSMPKADAVLAHCVLASSPCIGNVRASRATSTCPSRSANVHARAQQTSPRLTRRDIWDSFIPPIRPCLRIESLRTCVYNLQYSKFGDACPSTFNGIFRPKKNNGLKPINHDLRMHWCIPVSTQSCCDGCGTLQCEFDLTPFRA